MKPPTSCRYCGQPTKTIGRQSLCHPCDALFGETWYQRELRETETYLKGAN